MKGIALILAFFIFSTSIKASAFVEGISGAFQGNMISHSCCKTFDDSAVKECSDSDEDNQEENSCCEGNSCKCSCCLHITFLQHFSSNPNQISVFSEVKFGYSFLYHAEYLRSIFHPPTKI